MSTNPYESPTVYGSGDGPVGVAPVAGIVFGILNLLFGIIGICSTGLSSLVFLIPFDAEMVQQNPPLKVMYDSQIYKFFIYGSIGVGLIFSAILIAAGVGLLMTKPYGRLLSIWYGWYGIIICVLTAVVNLFVLFPAMIEHMNNMPQGPGQIGGVFGIVANVAGVILSAIYPGLLLFFMYRPNIIAAYRGK